MLRWPTKTVHFAGREVTDPAHTAICETMRSRYLNSKAFKRWHSVSRHSNRAYCKSQEEFDRLKAKNTEAFEDMQRNTRETYNELEVLV